MGHIISDEGSGYDIGRKALSAIFKSYDGITRETMLTEKILSHFNFKNVDRIIEYVYNNKVTKEYIAQIAPIVIEAAYENDRASIGILDESIDNLVEITETVIRKLEFDEGKIDLVLDGGILKKVKYMQDKFREKIDKRIDNIHIAMPLFDGAVGSLLIAWNYLNIDYSLDDIMTQVKEINGS